MNSKMSKAIEGAIQSQSAFYYMSSLVNFVDIAICKSFPPSSIDLEFDKEKWVIFVQI